MSKKLLIEMSEMKAWPTLYRNLANQGRVVNTTRRFPVDNRINNKIRLWKGDMTSLRVDALVTPAPEDLHPTSGLANMVHRAAGAGLAEECARIGRCRVGSAVMTRGHNLPAKNVIHMVMASALSRDRLSSAYTTCLDLAAKRNLRTIAFPCLSSGEFGFPHDVAAKAALNGVRSWMQQRADNMSLEALVFCVLQDADLRVYMDHLPEFFPVGEDERGTQAPTRVPEAAANDTSTHVFNQDTGRNRRRDGNLF